MSDKYEGDEPEDFHRLSRYARPTVLTVFRQLGYDLYDQRDINRLRENLEFAQKSREHNETIKNRRIGWWISLGIAILSAIATTVGEWIVGKFSK